MNPQFPATNACFDVTEQVLIGRNLECRGCVRPGNRECAVRLDAGEVRDRPGFCRNVTVAPDARDVAAPEGERGKGQQFCRRERSNRDGVHRNWISFR